MEAVQSEGYRLEESSSSSLLHQYVTSGRRVTINPTHRQRGGDEGEVKPNSRICLGYSL